MFYTDEVSESVTDPFPCLESALSDVRRLDDQLLVEALQGLQLARRRADAEEAVLVGEVVRRIEALGYPVSGASEELATMLVTSPRSADRLLDASVGLCERGLVWSALADGRIDRGKALLIIRELQDVPDPDRERLELVALGFAEGHTTHQLRRRLHQMCGDADPDETIRGEQIDKRGVWISPRAHGMADVYGYLSLEQAEAFMQSLEQAAAAEDCPDPYGQGEARSAAQRRADALTGFLDAHCVFDVTVDVVISADALIGDNDWTPELKRRGPIGSEVARMLCWSPDARWRRLVTDPCTGSLVDMAADSYRIPRRIREAVKARDRFCTFPGCHQPAEFFDIDHIQAWPKGKTEASNLSGRCRRHHVVKTHSAWKVSHDPTGPRIDQRWTSPLGQVYMTGAWDYRQPDG